MPGPLIHLGITAMCPHGGSVSVVTSNTRVLVSGQPVATLADQYPIAACPFQIPVGAGTKPQPCMLVKWLVPALRVKVMGQPVILQMSTGLCQSAEQIPQGPPSVTVAQTRVVGT
jgi:uncharacterized Zn-binding protein involved in type VI secretion